MREGKMNILIIGPSGAGKSTIIKAISGKTLLTGIGEGQTQEIEIYESEIWPLNLIDTKGFEYNFMEKLKTIRQIRNFTKKHLKNNNEIGIDAVWYCIDGMTGRVFFENIKTMSKAIKGWNNIPIFAVITKSIVEDNIELNIKAVQNSFAKSRGMNLKNIIPIVAEEYKVGDNVVAPFGIEKLCEETLNCYEEAKRISVENRRIMLLKQKKFTSQTIVVSHSTAALAIGTSPLPSAPILVPIEVSLIQLIFKTYNVELEKSILTSFVTTGVVTNIGKSIAESAVKIIPGVSLIYGVVAAIIVTVLGESTILVAENVYNGKIDSTKVDDIMNAITAEIKNSQLIEACKSYLVSNKENIKGKSANEIYEEIKKYSKK